VAHFCSYKISLEFDIFPTDFVALGLDTVSEGQAR